jgi:arginase
MTTQPSLVAAMVAALALRGGERVLQVGTGPASRTAYRASARAAAMRRGALGRPVRCTGARLELCEALIGCQPCRVPVCLIDVPFAMGDDRHDASDGGRRLIGGGGRELFARRGIACRELRVARRAPFADTASACLAVHHELAAAVATAAAVGELPIVIAGSCDAATGLLGGLARERCGVVWIDAHADFNTPDSTVTGFFPGMALAIVTGHCYAAWWAQIGNAAPVPETHVALFGIRELSPDAERERVERSRILRVAWLDGQPDGDIDVTVATLADRVEHVYLHIDLDALDPSLAPGIVDKPVPQGLSLPQLDEVLDAVTGTLGLHAVALTTYTPSRDVDGATHATALHVLARIADHHAAGRR